MSARALVVGLDGADLDVIGAIGRARLPHIHALMDRGAWARLASVSPPATLPNWTTFLTGVDPGRHGVFDFTLRRGYRVEFTGGTIREAPTIALRLDRLKMRCACIGFPATWPPEPLEHGIFVSGWDSPVAFEADRSFVWPPALYDELRERFGPMRFDDVDELDAETPGWHERLPNALCERIAHKRELACALLERESWDLFAFYFGESDTAAHHLWAHWDERSPRHPAGAASDGLARVYEALDRAVGDIVERAGPEAEVTLVSDHGSGGSSDKVLYLNRALADAGFLAFHEGSMLAPALARVKDAALKTLTPRMREHLFSMASRALPGFIESRARFSAIDFSRTRAFSEELNYFPSIAFNVRGREPDGQVDPSDIGRLTRELETFLLALRDPFTGKEVIESVWPREELYEGPYLDRAPDLIIELKLDREYSVSLMPSAGAPAGTGPWRRLEKREHLGRKGRSLPGSHRAFGLFVAAGPSVRPVGEVRARMADTTATLLSRLGVEPSAEMSGRVLREALANRDDSTPLPFVERPTTHKSEGTRLERRLRALGYIE